MKLNDIVRKEIDTDDWQSTPELVKRVLAHLNNLHRDAVQRVLAIESQIQEVGGEPNIKVAVTWPEPPPEPEPEPEEPI